MSTNSPIDILMERDAVAAIEHDSERKRLVQEAMDAHVDLMRAKKAYAEACARLIPLRHELTTEAA